jgi:hypothetical protein
MDAVEEALKGIAGKKDVRLVSFRQFVDWLDAQDPAVLAKLRTLDVGQRPAGGWGSYLTGGKSSPEATPSGSAGVSTMSGAVSPGAAESAAQAS